MEGSYILLASLAVLQKSPIFRILQSVSNQSLTYILMYVITFTLVPVVVLKPLRFATKLSMAKSERIMEN